MEQKQALRGALELLTQSEKGCLLYMSRFTEVFLKAQSHTLEDMYLHQIEVPEARKVIGFRSPRSLTHTIYFRLLEALQGSATHTRTSTNDEAELSIRDICTHIEHTLAPLFTAWSLCWEWVLQAVDSWMVTETNLAARLPDCYEKLQVDLVDMPTLLSQLTSEFYRDIDAITPNPSHSSSIETPIWTMVYSLVHSGSPLKEGFTLPLLRALNYAEILRLIQFNTPVEHVDYLSISAAVNCLQSVATPLFHRAREYHRNLVPLQASLPLALQEKVGALSIPQLTL